MFDLLNDPVVVKVEFFLAFPKNECRCIIRVSKVGPYKTAKALYRQLCYLVCIKYRHSLVGKAKKSQLQLIIFYPEQ